MSHQETEFKNENIHVKVSREPGAKVKFDISVSPKGVEAAHEKAIKAVNKEVSLPGFRKGKAPEKLLTQHYSKYIDQEWRDILLNTAFQEAISLTHIYPYTEKSVKAPQVKSISRETGAEVQVLFEERPQIPEVNPQDLNLAPVETRVIKDEDVENTIHDIRLHHAIWEDILDRPIQEGDFVDLTIDSLDEPQQNICTDTRFEVTDGKMPSWMRKLVIGKSVNETAEGISEKEESHCQSCESGEEHTHTHDQNFKPTNCRITIKAVKTAKLHELNEELAAKTGLKTIDELNERVRSSLEQQAKEEAKAIMRKQLDEKLAERYFFEIPASITESEIRRRSSHKISHLNTAELDADTVASKKEELKEEAKREVENAYRTYFILHSIAEQHHIQVSSEEIMHEFMRQLTQSPNDSIVDQSMEPKEIQARLQDYLLTKKTQDFLIEQALEQKNTENT